MRTRAQRRHLSALAIIFMLSFVWPIQIYAQSDVPALVFRPHCEKTDQTLCSSFDVEDPSTLRTAPLAPGDSLDLDIALVNPTREKIGKLRIWISYDSELLEGTVLSISNAFPAVVPGQSDFSPLSGYAKIAASANAGNEPSDAIVPVARVVFIVKNGSNASSTPLSFYDQRAGTEGHTFVTTAIAAEQNLLSTPLGTLMVQFASSFETKSASSAYDSSTISSSNASSAHSSSKSSAMPPADSAADSTTFGIVQMQNIRVSTKDDILYVTWDALSHPKLQGYNVYYGTLRGRYLNRRGVSVASRGAVIRDLPKDKTYYVAVRGVSDENQETAFSPEESVEIGNPQTSSAPITGSLDLIAEVSPGASAPQNPVGRMQENPEKTPEVPGKSGAPSGLTLLLLGSAAIGALFACRRQVTAARKLQT
ncbi:fibronectin type III domain-containing protein [Candidatus Peregrinibacteria bacterium]|nr:fibronectin type III domain-containing protein [Candidatus Peregrinibacteria bacterium]